MIQLAPDIYIETRFLGVTLGVILSDEAVLCVNAPTLPADARQWREELAQLTAAPIQYVIQQSHQLDYMLGNYAFDAPVLSSEAAAEKMRGYPETFRNQFSLSGADYEQVTDLGGTRLLGPQVTCTRQLTLYLKRREVRLLHAPGPDSSTLWVILPGEHILFAGDSVAAARPPVFAECRPDDWLASLDLLRKGPYRQYRVVPGRGRPVEPADLTRLSRFIREARRRVERVRERGKQRSDVATLVPDFLDYWQVPPEQRERMRLRLQLGLERLWDVAVAPPAEVLTVLPDLTPPNGLQSPDDE